LTAADEFLEEGMSAIRVQTDQVLSQFSGRPFGININYLRDHDSNRPQARPLAEAVLEMGAGHLRYPGGEKSDWVLFEHGKPHPLEKYEGYARGHTLMDLDDFIALCRQTGAQPHVVVAYDSQERTGVSEDAYLANALGMLRHANLDKGYGVVFWEIGNENWHNQTATPQEMARVIRRFSRAMKALDPGIKICVSGQRDDWWQAFLPLVEQDIDCLVVSQYSCMDWGSYDYFVKHDKVDLVAGARAAIGHLHKLLPGRRDQVQLIIAELNSKDYADLFNRPHWADDNNLGHALVTFCIFAQMLELPEVAYGLLWNTRWMDQQEDSRRIWYGLGSRNQLLPSSQPIMLLSRFLKDSMLACEALPGLMAFVSAGKDGAALNLFVVNKGLSAVPCPPISLEGGQFDLEAAWVYTGSGPDDLHPALSRLPDDQRGTLAACSLTIYEYRRK